MIDHTGLVVSDFVRSKAFYTQALGAIGLSLVAEIPAAVTGRSDIAGFGVAPAAEFWIDSGVPNKPALHIAFRVKTHALVDDFYKAAVAAGGRDNGPPGIRPHYDPSYYAAFVLDPDGHNIEAVCHEDA